MNTYEQIVRELADMNPYEHGGDYCQECWRPSDEVHAAKCLWLRAKQAVEQNTDAPKKIRTVQIMHRVEVINGGVVSSGLEAISLALYDNGDVRWVP
jgi:hypothetical protein